MPKKLTAYTVRAAAEELGVSVTTIYAWIREGSLAEVATIGARRGKGHVRLVEAASVLKLKSERQALEAAR